jgi:hypothetical protein
MTLLCSRPFRALPLLAALSASISSLPPRAEGAIETEAVIGQPFGVGRITLDVYEDKVPEALGIEGIGLKEKNGRIFYPAIDNPALRKLVKELLDAETPLSSGGPLREGVGEVMREFLERQQRTTIYFLFRGNEPLEVSLQLRKPVELTIVPKATDSPPQRRFRRTVAAGGNRRLLLLWWQQYAKGPRLFEPTPDYPPLVQTYLTATLARRLNLRLPEETQTPSADASLRKEIGFNLGTESLRMAMMQDRILGLNDLAESADQPLPEALNPPELVVPEPAADVKIEPMAMRVPAECFYARFGSFANFLWLQDTLAKWGGDAQNLIALRGLDLGMSQHMEKQLVLRQTVLSRLLGDTVIADVAIVGTDMFLREGASYGIIFHARNNAVLTTSLVQQRQERMQAGGVTEQKLTIDGRSVSYLASPDGAVRSYYVVDGDFQFVSTSKHLVARFLATSSGKGSLGATKEFRYARTLMPLGRGDTIWLYASDAFFRNITSPHYRIEMARRLQAASDIDLVDVARLAAACEGKPAETIEQLKTGNLLPAEFGPLPGGSQVVLQGSEVHDSLRGRRGAFLPVADTPVENATQAEVSQYRKFVDFYRANWGRMDPIIAGVKRTALANDREQVVIDVLMSPFAPQHFALLREQLGPADSRQLAPIAGNVAAFEAVMTGGRIFGALCDREPSQNAGATGWFVPAKLRELLVGYVGTTGALGPLAVLNLGFPPSDAAGYSQSRIGGWRRESADDDGKDGALGRYTVFSFHREVLESVTPQLRLDKAARPAQIRLRLGDVSNARVTPGLNDLAYARTRETSLGNLRLLHAVNQQLHVPLAACRDKAEFLLDAKLICPLGGKYVLREPTDETAFWTSTALDPTQTGGFLAVRAPKGYLSPPLNWLRGLDLDATMTEKSVSAHAEVIMQTPAKK